MGAVDPVAEPAVAPAPRTAEVSWSATPVSALGRGDRRFEAAAYLSDGYGLRVAIQARPSGWATIGSVARVWQPSRLKGISVSPSTGVPFLAAGQMFEARPRPRKWLSRQQTPEADDRFCDPGTILVSCSGIVGRVTTVRKVHEGCMLTHDLLRAEPMDHRLAGWLYAYMRTNSFRSIAAGAQYGHVIKHIETSHLSSMPIIEIDTKAARWYHDSFRKVTELRDRAYDLTIEAEDLYADTLGADVMPSVKEEAPFVVSSGTFSRGRRRLDAFHHNPAAAAVADAQTGAAKRIDYLGDLVTRVWRPGIFTRVFAENGTPYVSADELFDINAPVTKRVYAGQIPNREDYVLDAEWLIMARSGQIYGLNGSVRMVGHRLTHFIVSEDLIRIAPDTSKIRSGYLLCVLSHPTLGRPGVIRHAYGTSIPHLEPSDVALVPVPRLDADAEAAIADRFEEAAELSATADDLEDKMTARAEQVVSTFLHGLVAVQ